MTEYLVAFAAAGSRVHECAGNSRGCANSHRGGAHHGVMKFAHGQRANKQVDVMLVNGFAAELYGPAGATNATLGVC